MIKWIITAIVFFYFLACKYWVHLCTEVDSMIRSLKSNEQQSNKICSVQDTLVEAIVDLLEIGILEVFIMIWTLQAWGIVGKS